MTVRRHPRGRFMALLAALLMTVTLAAPAEAYVAGGRYTYAGAPECTWGYVELGGGGTPILYSWVEGDTWTNGCHPYAQWQGSYSLLLRQDLWKWGGSAWYTCNAGPWTHNPNTAAGWSQYWNPGFDPCGPGAYTAAAGAYQFDWGSWRGGWVGTGNYLYF